jgi:predicted nuclease of restriction endonuclease-like (RecB) superfamily
MQDLEDLKNGYEKNNKQIITTREKYKNLISRINNILEQGRKTAYQTVNNILTTTYWHIGRQIVEFEQGGKERAEYGSGLLQKIADDLTTEFGKGFSIQNLERIRKFYLMWPVEKVSIEKEKQISSSLMRKSNPIVFKLSWTHYVRLMSIENPDERKFYEIECGNNNWSVRELCRQFDSSLYERLALSRDKKGVKALAEKGQIIEKPEDLMKDPYVLEFLGLKEDEKYSESELETAIINNLL